MATVEERIVPIIRDHLGVEESTIKPDAKLEDDLGADSLDQVELLMAVEEEFVMDISDEDVWAMKTVKDVIDYVEKRVTANA